MFLSIRDRHGVPVPVPRSDHERKLEVEIEGPAGSELRWFVLRWPGLTGRPVKVGPTDDDGAGAPVIRDGDMFPVRHEGVFLAANHGADIRGMFHRGIKIGVAPDL